MKGSIIVCLLFLSISISAQEYTKWVNPFIGSSNFGATNPGALVPQGMVSVVPFNVTGSAENTWDKDKGWWSTPYAADNSFFTGFSHVNLSGVGCPELGVVLVMPTTGKVNAKVTEYGSLMSSQKASPGYYSCNLDKYSIKAEATATQRSGLSQFTFPAGQSNILIDLGNGLTNESGANIRIVNEQEVEGWRMTGNFCYHTKSERPVYFVARFSKKPISYGVWKKMPALDVEAAWSANNNAFNFYEKSTQPTAGDSVGAYFTFETQENEQVLVQVGISYVSIANARENIDAEQNSFDFSKLRSEAEQNWEQTLSRVEVEGGTDDQKTVFYTALYHLHIHPNIINDVNGQYPEMESYTVGQLKDGNRYTVFSLWDTYRNYHPLMSLLYPDLQLDFVRSMVAMYNESGWLPKWELNGRETYTMNGDPAFPVIADTYLRGLSNFAVETAYEGMLKHYSTPSAENKIRGDNDFYLEYAYVPLREEFDNSTSEALELYVADWNFGQLALALGKNDDYKRFSKQSLGYKNYFDSKEYKMIRPKLADGEFLTPFDPLQGENFKPAPGFHEGTAWQYTFGVPHDIKGLKKLMGGNKAFTEKLQMVFDDSLFDMANEPDMHYPFLFNYVKGEEWRSQKETSRLVKTYFKNKPDGLPGNDDCGTMSAWAVFSMMGLYPTCPGNMNYAIVQPVFDKISIKLDSTFYKGKSITITKSTESGNYIKQIQFNGKVIDGYFINHNELTKGGKLTIE